MNMKHWFLPFMTLAMAMAAVGTVSAADPQLLNLVMPDAKVLAGVNVDQAKVSPFGLYVLTQIQAQDQRLKQFVAQSGFDPTRDLHELLMASTGSQPHAPGLVLARGTFAIDQINAAAQAAGATPEDYHGVTILQDPKKSHGFAFLSATVAVAGDVATVKAAIDRQTAPAPLPADLLVKVNQLSGAQDAWAISQVPPPNLTLPNPNGTTATLPLTAFQSVQQASGGVKLATGGIDATGELQADTAANAQQLADVLQFLVNLGQMQTQQSLPAAGLLKSLTVAASGKLVDVSLHVPEAQAETLFTAKPKPAAPQNNQVRPRRRPPVR